LPHAVLPALVGKMPYDTLKDLVPISQTQWTYNVLVVRSNVPAQNMGQLVELVKKAQANWFTALGVQAHRPI